MNKILIVGNDGSGTSFAAGGGACIARTKRFFKALSEAGFDVSIFSPTAIYLSGITEFLKKGKFDCVVAISPHPAESAALALSNIPIPLWIDINGMHPAEVLLSGEKQNTPRKEMLRILALENSLLSRGDFFSAPSKRQTFAILGELLLLGRLNSSTKTNVPVKAIPHCAHKLSNYKKKEKNNNTFSVISTGSFNSWFDSETLFDGLIYAMQRNKSIQFIATGGPVPFAKEQYELFINKLSKSKLKHRFRMTGWVSKEELERIYASASLAIYTDIPSAETLLGARTRVLDWISRGIPVVCTEGAEISEIISTNKLGLTVPQQSSETLGKAILTLCENSVMIKEIEKAQKEWCLCDGSMESVFKPLIEWCSNPTKLANGQLCQPTVPKVSSFGYRKKVFYEIKEKLGTKKAIEFVLISIKNKFIGSRKQ